MGNFLNSFFNFLVFFILPLKTFMIIVFKKRSDLFGGIVRSPIHYLKPW